LQTVSSSRFTKWLQLTHVIAESDGLALVAVLAGRSKARLPTGHPSWPTCQGTNPTLVLRARVHEWSLPAGWPARTAYTGTGRASFGYRCMKIGWVATSPQVHVSFDTNGDRPAEAGHPVERVTSDLGWFCCNVWHWSQVIREVFTHVPTALIGLWFTRSG